MDDAALRTDTTIARGGVRRWLTWVLAAPGCGDGASKRGLSWPLSTSILFSALLLSWPAFYNGYPLVFSDTGTYLAQAMERYLGWDRPVFYSFFLLPLHWSVILWPVIAVQALLTAHTLDLARRAFSEVAAWWTPALASVLTVATALPWFVSQLMPDLFTSLLVVAIVMLLLVPERLRPLERGWLTMFATFMVAVHQSNLPLLIGIVGVLAPLRVKLGARAALGPAGWLRVAAAPVIAAMALVSVNLIGHGRPSLAPFGNVFLLTRVIYDGPGQDVLRLECPAAGWRLCDLRNEFPSNADDFMWAPDGPLARIGARTVAREADAIIAAAVRLEPGAVIRAAFGNAARQFVTFASGDGLRAWPRTVTPAVQRHFPRREFSAYSASRQTRGILHVPAWLALLHTGAAVVGMAATLAAVVVGWRRHDPVAGLCLAVLLALCGNAAITGVLSGPQDRYQSRVIWLAVAAPLIAAAALRLPRPADSPPQRARGG